MVWGLRLALGLVAVCAGSGVQALECKKPRTRVDKAICSSAALRQGDQAIEKAFAEALARAPAKAQALRASQVSWLADREAGCATPDRNALSRCLEAQDRLRMQALAIMAPAGQTTAVLPAPAAPAPAASARAAETVPQAAAPQPSASPPDDTVRPAAYVSDAVLLRLDPGGAFEMRELGGSRQASGHYVYSNGVLTLLDAGGDIGKTKFPLHCQVQRTVSGFAVSLGQSTCRPLDGIAFRLAS